MLYVLTQFKVHVENKLTLVCFGDEEVEKIARVLARSGYTFTVEVDHQDSNTGTERDK